MTNDDTNGERTIPFDDSDESVDLHVADDPDDADTIVTGMTVSAEEKISTGDYESYTPYASRRVVFRPAIDVSDPAGRVRVRRDAMRIHRDIQNDLQAAIDARLSAPDFKDWPNGVEPANLEGDE